MRSAVSVEEWPIAGDGFVISRETKKAAHVVTVTLERGGLRGMGECVPLKRYGHTTDSIKQEIDAWLRADHPWTVRDLMATLHAGPARFALDTAILSLEAAEHGKSFADYVGIANREWTTAYTLSGASPSVMADAALAHRDFRWLKLKLMGDGLDAERLRAVHDVLSEKELIVDANEALSLAALDDLMPVFEFCNVVLIEQPLPAADDDALRGYVSPIPFAADESCHDADDLDNLVGKYAVANIKLDKAGGLTHAKAMMERARELGLKTMIGCMASTGLSILPACALADMADLRDLDGALLLEKDRPNSVISYRDSKVFLLDSEP